MIRPTRIRFIGQCLLRGYPGVSRDEVFAAVAARRVASSRDETPVAISAGEFYHPLQLSRQVDRAVGRADVVVIDVAGLPVATGPETIDLSRLPRWVVAVDDRIRHLRELRHQLSIAYPRGERVIELVETHARGLAKSALRPLIRRYPKPTLQEYERLLTEAVNRIQDAKQRLVLQGPTGFNPDEATPSYSPDTLRIYDEVNAMARRVAVAAGLPLVDRIAIGHDHPSLFLGGSRRYSPLGHRVMGEALAERFLRSGVV
jgi:hypothetical protein